MKVNFLEHTSLDTLKANVEENLNNYKSKDNKWIEEQLEMNLFLEFHREVEEFSLDPAGKEIDNAKTLYLAMREITDSEATDERLWAGMAHGGFWDFMHENVKCELEKNKRIKLNENTILNRYFYNTSKNGRKRSIYINNLSKLWWVGRLCYNEEDEADPFKYLTLFERAFSHKLVLFSSNNIISNKNIRFAFFDAGLYIQGLGIEIKSDTLVPLLMYLNEIGGQIILDLLRRDEVYNMLLEFVDENLEDIKSR